MEKIRVLIAEDFEPIRERYVHMLEKTRILKSWLL